MADNTEVINGAYAAFAKGDVPALLALMSNTVEWECPKPLPQAGSYHGPDGVGEFFAGIAASWPELNIGIDDMVASGDNVVAVGHGEGKLASGEAAAYGFAHVFTLADGKVVRFREYVDPVQGLL
jgi:ketosteroid isomerase-like protein